MSRARGESHVYVTAADLPDAADRVAWAWDDQRCQQWTTDQHRLAEHLQAMLAERDQLRAEIPPEPPAGQLDQIRHQQTTLQRDLANLETATGRWADTEVGWAHFDLLQARAGHDRAVHQAQQPRQGPLARRRNQQDLEAAVADLQGAEQRWEQTIRPHTEQLHVEQTCLSEQQDLLEAAGRARGDYLDTHPEVIARLQELNRAIDRQRRAERHQCRTGQPSGQPRPDRPWRPAPTHPGEPTWTEPAQPAGPDL